MKNKGVYLSLLVLMVAGIITLSGCPTPVNGNGTGVDQTVTVKFDFSGTYDPAAYGVTPFVVGGVGDYIAGGADWDACISNGINADGTGAQILTSDGGLYKTTLTIPDNGSYIIELKAANYSTNDWMNVATNFWSTIGSENTGTDNEQIVVQNNIITMAILKGVTNVGSTISSDGKTVTIDVAAHGGWGLDIVGSTAADINVVLMWTNVSGGLTGSGLAANTLWYPLMSVESNTNTGVTSAAAPVITGNGTWMHMDGTSTWTPAQGKTLTVDSANSNLSISLTVPAGSGQAVQYKAANVLGWNRGEEANNIFLPLPSSSASTITNIVAY
jgi:hypothetical protein